MLAAMAEGRFNQSIAGRLMVSDVGTESAALGADRTRRPVMPERLVADLPIVRLRGGDLDGSIVSTGRVLDVDPGATLVSGVEVQPGEF